jgi:RNA-dependent RNA polymerase
MLTTLPDASTYNPAGGKASSEQILTDGCGFMNRKALSMIAKIMNYEHIPTAVQGRIKGAKGLWLLHPKHQHDLEAEPLIWIRKSQEKINFSTDRLSRSHLIFDLVAPNRLTFPSRLSMQTIMNLSHNRVPEDIFVQLMMTGLSDDFEKLTTWEGSNAMKVVLHTVAKVGNVSGIRFQREAVGMGRALGHGRKREWDETVEIIDQGNDEAPVVGRAPFSLEPSMIGERIFEMILAGFHPLRSHTLHSALHEMVKNVINGYVKAYHIPNPQSCEAFIVPGTSFVIALRLSVKGL